MALDSEKSMARSGIGVTLTATIDKTVESLLESKKNVNAVIDLIECLMIEDPDQSEVVMVSCSALEKIFSTYITNGDLDIEDSTKSNKLDECSMEEKFIFWLREQYNECKKGLYSLLAHKNKTLKELAANTLVRFLLAECAHPLTKSDVNNSFPIEFIDGILTHLLSEDESMDIAIKSFEEYSHETNLVFFMLKCLHSKLKCKNKKGTSLRYMGNVFALLQTIHFKTPHQKLKKKKIKQAVSEDFEVDPQEGNSFSAGIQKKFSLAWLEFLKFKLSISLYKKVLVILHERVMPFMPNPLLLTDFLTESYNIGGIISLLALNGLFYLIRYYNLEYPEFYTKLYALLTNVVFHAKYRARFFYLTDLFLTSTHLPAYLVAAFAKKFARLSLVAPVDVILILLPMIGNLFIRHPSLNILIRRTVPVEVIDDPYMNSEPDPALCNVMESSLWEIKTLQNHWHPDVAIKAKFINKAMPSMEWDLSEVLETHYDELFEKVLENDAEDVSLSIDMPKGILDSGSLGNEIARMWSL